MYKRLTSSLLILMLILPFAAQADWILDDDASSLGFVSVKNGAVVESHQFKSLSGIVSDTGEARLIIDLDSVETLIPIRNERMRALLFNTTEFPEAFVSINLEMSRFNHLSSGDSLSETLKFDLTISGQTVAVSVPVSITKSADKVMVSSIKPVVINAGNWGLMPGIEALRAIAGLTSITPAVPVSFALIFEQQMAAEAY
jgi:polyisoprenoid-binding protein YceI